MTYRKDIFIRFSIFYIYILYPIKEWQKLRYIYSKKTMVLGFKNL